MPNPLPYQVSLTKTRNTAEVAFIRERYGLSLIEADVISRMIAALQINHEIQTSLADELQKGRKK